MSCVLYASDVGSLLYSMVCTRPDITHVAGILRRYMSKTRKEHWITIKRVFTHLCGDTNHAIYYQGKVGLDKVLDVHGFVDAE